METRSGLGGSTGGYCFGAGCSSGAPGSSRGTEEERFQQTQRMPSDGFLLPAALPLQSGCYYHMSDVESHLTSLLPTTANQWGLGNHSSSSASLMQMQSTPISTTKNFYPGSALQYTAGADHPISQYSPFPAFNKGSCMCLFNDKHLDAGEIKNREKCMDNQTAKRIQLRECEVLRTLQIPRHQMYQSPLEEYDDLDSRHLELKLILRKELTNSDVGNLGRIVLPKKEAEANLPPLFERDGMTLHMDDLILPITWKFKYRFWPNNRSRMYILESTGDFVRTHGLQTGDSFIIFRNSGSGTYIVRGKKGIQQPTFADVINPDYNNHCGINEHANSPA